MTLAVLSSTDANSSRGEDSSDKEVVTSHLLVESRTGWMECDDAPLYNG